MEHTITMRTSWGPSRNPAIPHTIRSRPSLSPGDGGPYLAGARRLSSCYAALGLGVATPLLHWFRDVPPALAALEGFGLGVLLFLLHFLCLYRRSGQGLLCPTPYAWRAEVMRVVKPAALCLLGGTAALVVLQQATGGVSITVAFQRLLVAPTHPYFAHTVLGLLVVLALPTLGGAVFTIARLPMLLATTLELLFAGEPTPD